jgi:molybdopterin synthase sulfur carrier subunit
VKITVKLGAPLSQIVGEGKVILTLPESATVADVLDELRRRSPDFEAGLKGKGLRTPLDQVLYVLFVNARIVPLDRAGDTPLRDGDRLSLFLPVAGG